MRVEREVSLEAQEEMLAASIHRAHRAAGQALRPAVEPVTRVWRLDLHDRFPHERLLDAAGGAMDGVAFGHLYAVSVSRRGPWRKPMSMRSGSSSEPTTG